LLVAVTAVGLSVLLVGLLCFVYLLVQGAASKLIEAQAASIVVASVRTFNALGHPPQNADMQAFVSRQMVQGLRYMALWDPRRGLVAEAGTPLTPMTNDVIQKLSPRPQFVGERVRIRMGPPERPHPPPGPAGAGWRPPPPAPWPEGAPADAAPPDGPPPYGMPPDGPPPFDQPPQDAGAAVGVPPLPPGGHPQAILEFEPVAAARLRSYAFLSLTLGLFVVAAVLGSATLLSRSMIRQNELSERVEHARRLAALGEMAAVIAHEIRNPLTALKGHAQLLRKSLAGDSRDEKAQRVVNEAVRLQNYLNDLLEFARSGSINPQPVDPLRVLRDSAEAVQSDRIVLESREALPAWRLDATRMQQAMTNILRNAVQMSPPDATVHAAVFADNGNLIFEVRDRGPGIPPGEEERIFEPFFTRQSRGTGLGLSLAQRIVAQHRGKITARNDPAGGAVFRIALENA
jgi:two-component system sensor histidine kinase HydH